MHLHILASYLIGNLLFAFRNGPKHTPDLAVHNPVTPFIFIGLSIPRAIAPNTTSRNVGAQLAQPKHQWAVGWWNSDPIASAHRAPESDALRGRTLMFLSLINYG